MNKAKWMLGIYESILIIVGITILLIFLITPERLPTFSYDPVLDGPFGQRGVNNLSGWSVGFTWMGDKEEFRDDIVSGSFDVKVNQPGRFSFQLPLDEHALNILGDTVVRIYYDGEPQFWGFVEISDIDEGNETVTITGGDMMARMTLRKVDYQAVTAYGSDPPRGDQDSKTVFEKLIQWYTGETSSDSMFAKEFVEWSETSYRYVFDGNSLHDALADVAESCSLTIGEKKQIGYGYWVDGNEYIYCQPYGWRKYSKEIPGFWSLSFDYSPVKNRVHFRGGEPPAYEYNEPGTWGTDHVYDILEKAADIQAWSVSCSGVTASECGGNLTSSSSQTTVGGNSGKLSSVSSGSGGTVTLTRTLGTSLDWTYIDEGGNVQNFLSMIRYHIKFQNDDPANDNIATSLRWGNDASNYWYQSTYPTHYGTSWNKTVIDPSETSFITEVGSVDYSVIDWFQLVITLNAGASGEIFIDGLAFFFKEVDVWRRDETSIQLHGLKEVKFQDRRITDWKTGQDIADNILELLKYPAVNGSTTIPYYDPDLKLNMLVEPEIEGVKWPLYINGLSVTWTGDHVSTSITAGRPVPDEEDIEISLKLLRDQDSEKGTGFESASTYYQTTCFKDKELYCRTDCMGTNCQNAAQLLSCFTFAERNPCTTTCQRYKERTGWLNRILNQ